MGIFDYRRELVGELGLLLLLMTGGEGRREEGRGGEGRGGEGGRGGREGGRQKVICIANSDKQILIQ